MTSPPRGARSGLAQSASGSLEWQAEDVLADYRVALLSRYTDDVEEAWKRVGRVRFQILGAGQEIAQVCAVRCLRDGDWMRGYYRGLAEVLRTRTSTVQEVLSQVLSNTEPGCDPSSGGRMMGRHFGSRLVGPDGEFVDLVTQINRASDVSSTGSQMGAALGLALASKVFRDIPELGEDFPRLSPGGTEVVHVSIGDASLAEGIALESVFQAVVQRAPMVISVYDNGYGISVSSEFQIPHASISQALAGLAPAEGSEDGLHIIGPVKGWEYESCRQAYEDAYEWVRRTGNPALVHSLVTQPRGHSSSGDHRRYKDASRLQWEEDHDPILHMREWLISEGHANSDDLAELEREAEEVVDGEAAAAWSDYYQPIVDRGNEVLRLMESAVEVREDAPSGYARLAARIQEGAQLDVAQQFLSRSLIHQTVREFLMSTRDDAGTERGPRQELMAFLERSESEVTERFSGQIFAEGSSSPCHAPDVPAVYEEAPPKDTGAHILSAGVATLMSADPRVLTFGEDTGGLGGVTTCSLGLQGGEDQVIPAIWAKSPALQRWIPERGFGVGRVWDVAIAEASIVGAASGLAARGLRPIAEIQYHDYAVYGIQQIIEEMACLRHRTAGGQECPAIIWCQGHRLLGMWHSGSPMGLFLTIPGLRVVAPRDAVQTVGMYRAILSHGRDPAFVVVPLVSLYAQLPVPENLDELCIPLGHSEVLLEGEHLTIVTYGHCCELAKRAAEQMQECHGLSVQVVDLQTLNPLDLNGVARDSILRTGRVLFLDEDYPNGAMSMISKTLLYERPADDGEQLLHYVEGVRVLTSPEHKPCYGEDGGYFSKPQVHQIVASLIELWNETLPAGAERIRVS